jgi:hypothetical protein
MAHVISTGKPKSGREPAVPVNTPMDLFRHNQVGSPTNEDTGKNSPEAHPGSNQKCWNAVDHEQENNVQWRGDERHVFRFLGSTYLRVVPVMSSSEWAARPVEQPAMIDVFESVTPDQTDDEANKPKLPTDMRTRIKTQQRRRYGSAQKRSHCVLSLLVPSMPDGDLRQFRGCRHRSVLPANYYKAEYCWSLPGAPFLPRSMREKWGFFPSPRSRSNSRNGEDPDFDRLVPNGRSQHPRNL